MPRIRSLHHLLSTSFLSIDERGLHRLVAAHIAAENGQLNAALSDDAGPEQTTEQRAAAWNDFLKSTGLFPYYVNPTGQVIHTLDPDAESNIQKGAVAVIPVQGTLVREAWTMEEVWWGMASSERLTNFIRKCTNDDRIVGAVAPTNSPGGSVSGIEDLGKAWVALGAKKETVQLITDMSASGAVWFGAGSKQIRLAGQISETGSVGVMMSWFDLIPLFETWGAKYHELYAPESDKKNEAHRELRERQDPSLYRKSMSRIAVLFQNVVKQGRGAKLSTTDAAVLQGRMYGGDDAIAVGLADGYSTLEECIHLVRTGTPTAAVPGTTSPTDNLPPNNDGTTDAKTTANPNPTNMSLKTMLIGLISATFTTKEDATAETITATNAALTDKGITDVAVVSTAEQTRLNAAAEAIAAAEQKALAADTAKQTAETALATEKTNAAAALATKETELKTAHTAALAAKEAELKTAHDAAIAAKDTEIEALKGQGAPSDAPAGATNKQGDVTNHTPSAEDKELADWLAN